MKVIICEDYLKIAKRIKTIVEDYCAKKGWSLECRIFPSGEKVLNEDLQGTDVAFLDVELPKINGIETARLLRQRYPDLIIIFVTQFIEYAPEGYHVSAFRYLLKNRINQELPITMDEIGKKLAESKSVVTVFVRGCEEIIPLKEVLYLEGTANRYVRFHMSCDHGNLEVKGKLTDFEMTLVEKGFLRIQRSFIVNMSQISKISSYQVVLRTGEVLKTSEKNYKHIVSEFLQWKGAHL